MTEQQPTESSSERKGGVALEHRYECANGHQWTTEPTHDGRSMKCPHCGTITVKRLERAPTSVGLLLLGATLEPEPDACPECDHPMADHYEDEGGCLSCACQRYE